MRLLWAMAVLGCMALVAVDRGHAQEITGFSQPRPAAKGHVSFLADAIELQAGKPAVVELRFSVDPGFHINSHQPSSELLIPTTLTLAANTAVKWHDEEYPKGQPFHLAVGTGETLDVYQGEFRIRLRMTGTTKGDTTVSGNLHYQACDSASCFPPRTLDVKISVKVH